MSFRCRRSLSLVGRAVTGKEVCNALQKLAKNIDPNDLYFLAELAEDIDGRQKWWVGLRKRFGWPCSIGIFLDSGSDEKDTISLTEGSEPYRCDRVFVGNTGDRDNNFADERIIRWVEEIRNDLVVSLKELL